MWLVLDWRKRTRSTSGAAALEARDGRVLPEGGGDP